MGKTTLLKSILGLPPVSRTDRSFSKPGNSPYAHHEITNLGIDMFLKGGCFFLL